MLGEPGTPNNWEKVKMRNSALSLLAALVMMVSFAVAPASANSDATGQNFSVSLSGMADFAMPGDTVTGQLSVTIPQGPGFVAARKQVFYTITVDTPFGDATVLTGSFRMTAGRTRTIPFSLPIDDTAAAGLYRVKVGVTIDGESLSVGHELEIGGKR
jgi:hypothetical protein